MRQPSGKNEEKTRSIHCFFSCSESFIGFYIMNAPYMSSRGYFETKSQSTCTYDLIKVVQACAETFTLFGIQRTGAYNVRYVSKRNSSGLELRFVLLLVWLPAKAIGLCLSCCFAVAGMGRGEDYITFPNMGN